jgi:general secretion pathway protein D
MILRLLLAALLGLVLAGCATTLLNDATRLAQAGQHEQALALLEQAALEHPQDRALRAALARQRELTQSYLLMQVDGARAGGRLAATRALFDRAAAIDPRHPRVDTLREEIERGERHAVSLAQAERALQAQRLDEAEARVREVLVEAPGLPAARELQRRIAERRPAPLPVSTLGPAFQKPVSLEFRDAPLRNVFEALGRGGGVSFVFDKDVRADARVTVMLRDVSLDEAMRIILATQQLDRKLLNESTVLIFPNNQAKQREHQELVTRSFYLTNADVKQAQALVRTIAKTRDLFIDERLNLMVVRDTPEVLRLVETLMASLDLPEPEVVLDVEVLEIASSRLDELGIKWPETLQYGIPGATGQIEWSARDSFRASIANPALSATLRGSAGAANILANPRLRARNHEKARVHVGEKLPVFTTTSTANVGVSASVSYLDIGLKLDVEPSVQLDNEVVMKVGLEVSNLVARVTGPQGSIAYQIGTRVASTSLRLKDGETQVLAGLINDEDRKSVNGVPGVSNLPVVGRLFGVHTDSRAKTEVVLLITPRVVRNLPLPDASMALTAAGVDSNPGAKSLRLQPSARVAVAAAAGGAPGPASRGTGAAAATPAAVEAAPTLLLSTSGKVQPGETVSVTLQNRSSVALQGELAFDASLLQAAQAGARDGEAPRLGFDLSPRGEQVFLLRALPAAAGQTTVVMVNGLTAIPDGGSTPNVEGSGEIAVGK